MPTTPTPQSLLDSAQCYNCHCPGTWPLIELQLLSEWLLALNPAGITDPQVLLSRAACFNNYSAQLPLIRLGLYQQISAGLSPTSDTTPQGLLASAQCFNCYGPGVWPLLELGLLASIVTANSPTSPTDPSIAGTTPCFNNLSAQWQLIQVELLVQIAQAVNPSAVVDPALLLQSAQCYNCYGPGLWPLLVLQLLTTIFLHSGGTPPLAVPVLTAGTTSVNWTLNNPVGYTFLRLFRDTGGGYVFFMAIQSPTITQLVVPATGTNYKAVWSTDAGGTSVTGFSNIVTVPIPANQMVIVDSTVSNLGLINAASSTGFYAIHQSNGTIVIEPSNIGFIVPTSGVTQVWSCVSAIDSTKAGFLTTYNGSGSTGKSYDFSQASMLQVINVSGGVLTAIDLSKSVACTSLIMENTTIPFFPDISNMVSLSIFDGTNSGFGGGLAIVIPTGSVLSQIHIGYSNIISLDVRNAAATITTIEILYSQSCTSLNITGCSHLLTISGQYAALTSLPSFTGCTALTDFDLSANAIAGAQTLAGATALTSFSVAQNPGLTSLDISAASNTLDLVQCTACGLSSSDTVGTNGILIKLAASPVHNGNVSVDGGTNATLDAAGLAAKTTLVVTKTWAVSNN
jgi:hypothetical protein